MSRRTLLKAAAAAWRAPRVAGPFVIAARGEEPVKIGLDNPLDRNHARAAGKNEADRLPARIEQINAQGGVLEAPGTQLPSSRTRPAAKCRDRRAKAAQAPIQARQGLNFLLGNVRFRRWRQRDGRRQQPRTCVARRPRRPAITDAVTGATYHLERIPGATSLRRRWEAQRRRRRR